MPAGAAICPKHIYRSGSVSSTGTKYGEEDADIAEDITSRIVKPLGDNLPLGHLGPCVSKAINAHLEVRHKAELEYLKLLLCSFDSSELPLFMTI